MRIDAFVSELRRRRVGRVAVAYSLAAWALIQVADVVLPRLAFPDWSVTLLIVVALACFPVALVLAWVYDVVPAADGAGAEDGMVAPARRPSRRIAAGAVLLVLVLAAGVTARLWPGLMDGLGRIESIAVLPFDNLSADPEQDYFVAGMHDALITELAQIGALRVLSRKSTIRYRDSEQSMSRIAQELGVDGIVEGSVLRVGSEMRMQVQLIRARPRERHVWAASYERDVHDARRLHGDIARTIAHEIGASLTGDEAARLGERRRVDPRAYEAYLRGMYFLNRQTPDDYRTGLRHLHEAVELDPADPHAYAALALGYSVVGHGTVPDAFERAKAAARRSLELDTTVAAAHEALAEIALYADWDFDAAERSFRRALSLEPNLPEAAAHYAWYLVLRGQRQAALEWMQRASSLDPLSGLWVSWIGYLHLSAGAYDSALARAHSALELSPGHPHALNTAGMAAAFMGDTAEATRMAERLDAIAPYRWGAARIYAELGRTERARAIIAEMEAAPRTPMGAFGVAAAYAGLGETERALDWLEVAHELRFSWLPWIHTGFRFRSLYGEPRFEALLRSMRVAAYSMDDARASTSLTRMDVYTTPGGTADIMQTFQMMPGVTRATEGSDLYVRGGDPAESPVWVDGLRLPYASTFESLHGGLFGVLDPSVLKKAYFSSGGFSARYGDALSGVLDLETDGRPEHASWRVGANLVSAGGAARVSLGARAGAWAAVSGTETTPLLVMQDRRDDYPTSPRAAQGIVSLIVEPTDALKLRATALREADHSSSLERANGYEGAFIADGDTWMTTLSGRLRDGGTGSSLEATLGMAARTTGFEFGVLDWSRDDRSASVRLDGDRISGGRTRVRAGVEAARISADERGTVPTTGDIRPGSPSIDDTRDARTQHLGGYVETELRAASDLGVTFGLRADRLPGLTETYIRAPRRHAQVKRYYDAYLRVNAALEPTIHATMTRIANRIRLGTELALRDSMAWQLEVATAIQNRRRELELRQMLADVAVGLYENPDQPPGLSPSVAPRPPTPAELDSISRARRALTPEQRERVNEGLGRSRAGSAAIMRRGQEIVAESRERSITQHLNIVERLEAELAEVLARRAAGRFAPRAPAE